MRATRCRWLVIADFLERLRLVHGHAPLLLFAAAKAAELARLFANQPGNATPEQVLKRNLVPWPARNRSLVHQRPGIKRPQAWPSGL